MRQRSCVSCTTGNTANVFSRRAFRSAMALLFDIVNIHLLAGDTMPDDGLRSGQRTIHAASMEWSRRPFVTFGRPRCGRSIFLYSSAGSPTVGGDCLRSSSVRVRILLGAPIHRTIFELRNALRCVMSGTQTSPTWSSAARPSISRSHPPSQSRR